MREQRSDDHQSRSSAKKFCEPLGFENFEVNNCFIRLSARFFLVGLQRFFLIIYCIARFLHQKQLRTKSETLVLRGLLGSLSSHQNNGTLAFFQVFPNPVEGPGQMKGMIKLKTATRTLGQKALNGKRTFGEEDFFVAGSRMDGVLSIKHTSIYIYMINLRKEIGFQTEA